MVDAIAAAATFRWPGFVAPPCMLDDLGAVARVSMLEGVPERWSSFSWLCSRRSRRCWRRRPRTSEERWSSFTAKSAFEWKLDGARIQVHQVGRESASTRAI